MPEYNSNLSHITASAGYRSERALKTKKDAEGFAKVCEKKYFQTFKSWFDSIGEGYFLGNTLWECQMWYEICDNATK